MNPGQAIKLRCKDCDPDRERFKMNFCGACLLKDKSLSNLKKIKNYCKIFCLNNHRQELCNSPDCSLFQYRFGKNPNVKGNIANLGKHSQKY